MNSAVATVLVVYVQIEGVECGTVGVTVIALVSGFGCTSINSGPSCEDTVSNL